MAVIKTDLVATAWTVIVEGARRLIAQSNGIDVLFHVGDEFPALDAPGFDIRKNEKFAVDDVQDFGATVWARALGAGGTLVFTAVTGEAVGVYVVDDYVLTDYFTP